MQTSQAISFNEFGTPAQVSRLVKQTLPEPGPNQVRVKMKLSPIHNHDVLTISGEYGVRPQLPAVGGTEALGVIDAVGTEVSNLNIGDRVTIVGVQGTWAEYFLANRKNEIPIPSNIPDELAAQLFSMPASAIMALNMLDLRAGDWLLVNAANGAVGKTIAQLAASRKIHTLNLVRSRESKQQLIELGIQNVFSTQEHNWKQQVLQTAETGKITGAIDMVGGTAAKDLFELVSNDATLLSFGAMANNLLQIDVADLIYKGTTLKGFWGGKEFAKASEQEIAGIFNELIKLAQQKKLTLPVAATFSLQQGNKALNAYFKERDGKILFRA